MSTTTSAAQPVISPGCGAYIDLPAETLDANDTVNTEVLETKGLHGVALQIVGVSGTHATHVITVQESMDGTTFVNSSIAVTGAGIASGITYARYVRATVTTVELASSTVTVRLYLS